MDCSSNYRVQGPTVFTNTVGPWTLSTLVNRLWPIGPMWIDFDRYVFEDIAEPVQYVRILCVVFQQRKIFTNTVGPWTLSTLVNRLWPIGPMWIDFDIKSR